MFPVCETQDYESNVILRALPQEDTTRIRHTARKVHVEVDQVLVEAGESPNFVYFPTTCVVSHSYTTREGLSASMALIGHDGIIGLPLLLGAESTAHRTVVQIGGNALKVAAAVVLADFSRAGRFQRALLRYTQAFITQVAQTAACNRLHPLQQRLCRCMLLCRDRLGNDKIPLTQESMASIVGGRRESVTLAAGRLQDLGIIRYTRGQIHIVDHDALETLVCECYAAQTKECNKLATRSARDRLTLTRTPHSFRVTR